MTRNWQFRGTKLSFETEVHTSSSAISRISATDKKRRLKITTGINNLQGFFEYRLSPRWDANAIATPSNVININHTAVDAVILDEIKSSATITKYLQKRGRLEQHTATGIFSTHQCCTVNDPSNNHKITSRSVVLFIFIAPNVILRRQLRVDPKACFTTSLICPTDLSFTHANGLYCYRLVRWHWHFVSGVLSNPRRTQWFDPLAPRCLVF